MGYRALEEAASMLKKYGREVARLLNQEHEDPNVLRYQLYVLRRRICRRLEKLGLGGGSGSRASSSGGPRWKALRRLSRG